MDLISWIWASQLVHMEAHLLMGLEKPIKLRKFSEIPFRIPSTNNNPSCSRTPTQFRIPSVIRIPGKVRKEFKSGKFLKIKIGKISKEESFLIQLGKSSLLIQVGDSKLESFLKNIIFVHSFNYTPFRDTEIETKLNSKVNK